MMTQWTLEQNEGVEPMEVAPQVSPISMCSHPQHAQATGLVVHVTTVLN